MLFQSLVRRLDIECFVVTLPSFPLSKNKNWQHAEYCFKFGVIGKVKWITGRRATGMEDINSRKEILL